MSQTQSLQPGFEDMHPSLTPREAVVEANRCLYCFDAPCTLACPTHIDVPGFIKRIASGNLTGSAFKILDANVLGLSCARVCPVNVLCEGACVMHRYNKQPIEIGRLQRHAMEHFYGAGLRLEAGSQRQGRVACIGAGPASLACAAELRRRGIAVTIFEKRNLPGGLNTYGVAEYKLTAKASIEETELIRALGVQFELGVVVGDGLPVSALEDRFDIVFLGVGLGPTQPLGIPGEDLKGVVDALRFIAEYKTVGRVELGRRVAVVGGGNTAMDAAVASRLLGATEVHMLYRRGEGEMPAFVHEYETARQHGVRFHWRVQPEAIRGNGAVERIECVYVEPVDAGGKRGVRPIPGSHFSLDCDMVIISIGQSRLLDFLAGCRGIELRNGLVVVDSRTGATANPRYFAAGDCVNGGREVVDAAAEGKRAAAGIAVRLRELYG
jgi:glutamate synthase (NADPH/NADH) small chain